MSRFLASYSLLTTNYTRTKTPLAIASSVFFTKLAITSVHCHTLVLLAAGSSLFDELLARLSESFWEVAAAAETHLTKHILHVGLDDHRNMGKGE